MAGPVVSSEVERPAADPEKAVLPPFPARELVMPTVVLAALAVAEWVTAAVDPRAGLVLHSLLLPLLVAWGSRARDAATRELYWSLTLAPIIRIGSLALPLGNVPLVSWYPLIGVPIFTGAFIVARNLGYTRARLGLRVTLAELPRQLALVPLGLILGVGEYLIFRPAPIAERFTLADIWLPALILLIFTGLEEELIFRGLMQQAALRALGRWGLVYVSAVFAVLHIGYLSILDVVFVFLVGMLFAVFVLRTRSLFGVTLCHGCINVMLFLILPFVAPVFLGTGRADLLPLPLPAVTPPPGP